MGDQNEGWELIYTTSNPYQAEIIRASLEENNIDCVIINKQDSSYLIFGEIELYVKHDDVISAKHHMNNDDIRE